MGADERWRVFAAGTDEEEVLLPVVEEAEIALRIARPGLRGRRRSRDRARLAYAFDDGGTRRHRAVVLHELADAIDCLGGDAAAIAQPLGELAVVDGAAAEGGFRKSAVPAIVGDFLQQFLRVHGAKPRPFPPNLRVPHLSKLTASVRRNRRSSEPRAASRVNHKASHSMGGQCYGEVPNIEKMQVFPVRRCGVRAVVCQKCG